MRSDVRKPVSKVSDLVRHETACPVIKEKKALDLGRKEIVPLPVSGTKALMICAVTTSRSADLRLCVRI